MSSLPITEPITGTGGSVSVRYDVPVTADDWVLPEVPVPESVQHREIVELVAALLAAWAARMGNSAFVARNLAFRWVEQNPKIGVDPDVCLIEPAPPDPDELGSLLLWAPGHHAPRLAIEVVSKNHPYKDYEVVPDKYAASGVGELWVFDPQLIGPRKRGGPHRFQLWTRSLEQSFVRVYAGEGPMLSPALNAWALVSEPGHRLRIADDAAGASLWLTNEEAERAARQVERAAAHAERAEKEAALRRVAELEAELANKAR
jgi:Uma2 family endonuclease